MKRYEKIWKGLKRVWWLAYNYCPPRRSKAECIEKNGNAMGIHGNTYRMTMSDVWFQKRCRIASATSSLALLQRSAAAARARQREFSRASALQKCAKHKTETNTKHTKRWPKCCKMVHNGAKWYNMVQNACASGSGHEGRFNVYGYIGHFYALHCIAMIAYVCVGLQSNHGLRHSSCAFSLSLGSTHIRWQVSKRCECTSAHTSRNDGQCVYSHPSYLPILLFWAVPLPNTLLWHIRTEDFYRRDFLAESFKQIKFEIPTFWLGLSAIPVQVCKGMMLHHVALSCTTQHGGAPSMCLQISLAGLLAAKCPPAMPGPLNASGKDLWPATLLQMISIESVLCIQF